jgi:hypothetical protein
VKKIVNFFYALFFTRDDDLDVLQLLFTTIVVIAIILAWKANTVTGTSDAVRIETIVTLRWMVGLLAVTAVPKWLAPLIADKIPSILSTAKNNNPPPTDISS